MGRSLRERWQKRLEAAQADSSWQARAEVRVLRFLLARYAGSSEEAPLADFPLYEGEAPYGRTRLPLSRHQMVGRLRHIAQVEREHGPENPISIDWEKLAYRDVMRHQRDEKRRQRFRTRKERGYW